LKGGSDAWIDRMRQPVLEVPGEAATLGIGEGVAICVYYYPQHGFDPHCPLT